MHIPQTETWFTCSKFQRAFSKSSSHLCFNLHILLFRFFISTVIFSFFKKIKETIKTLITYGQHRSLYLLSVLHKQAKKILLQPFAMEEKGLDSVLLYSTAKGGCVPKSWLGER